MNFFFNLDQWSLSTLRANVEKESSKITEDHDDACCQKANTKSLSFEKKFGFIKIEMYKEKQNA